MQVKMINRKEQPKYCLGCYKEIKKDGYYDGEDYWHCKCYENFLYKIRHASDIRVQSVMGANAYK